MQCNGVGTKSSLGIIKVKKSGSQMIKKNKKTKGRNRIARICQEFDTKTVKRSHQSKREKNTMTKSKRTKRPQKLFTKHYTEKSSSSNKALTTNRG